MSRRTVVGVMGGSVADERTLASARELGRRIAEGGWVLLSGGRPTGAMQASITGAHEAGGLTVGVLFDDDKAQAAEGLDIVIPTGMGAARNIINVLASDVVVACRGNGGTLSEIAMALRFGRPVVLLDFDPGAAFLDQCGPGRWSLAATPAEAVAQVAERLAELGRT
ncbi:MAG TPA: DNA-binding protein [Candidatus Krumholzibacteria bacterium]|nr:DNA-binding protein [Candidatus Krumholzibacteria bacterium]